jgi:hypothetical protein
MGVALLLLALAPSASAAGFEAGAGRQLITPPTWPSPAADAANAKFAPAFATVCAAFPDHGRFALQEPFIDNKPANGQWDPGEPFCDANANGRWDGIYADNNKGPATGVHDDIDVRAVALSDGRHRPLVYASVDQIGLFDFYTEEARTVLRRDYGVDADLVVSANHNESSPDSIGLFGPITTPVGVGLRSGIDEYYMDWVADAIAHAAADSVHSLRPASLYAKQVESPIPDGASGSRYPLLTGLSQRISDQFPTAVALPNDDRIAAVDPKMGVLQARANGGTPIFTVVSVAAHNQEMGNAGAEISSDWPGALERSFDAGHPGMAMYLVGDNGSEEDPQTEPPVVPNGSENHTSVATQYTQAQATGARFAAVASDAAQTATRLRPGDVVLHRRQICVPLENNGFVALAAAGEFGRRQGYACDASGNPVAPVPNGSIVPTVSNSFRTFVGYSDIGPDLQLIQNPAESFPALMLGSPFGIDEESCDRPNPAVPTWHARAPFRFQVGLADDLIGYLIPAWGFASGTPGLFSDPCYQDMHGHGHKLESESVGPTGGNDVANATAAMLAASPDPIAHVVDAGRFVLPDGSLARWPTGAAGALLADGTTIGAPTTAGFGSRAVDRSGVFMDYDGQPQQRPDVTTRGMMVLDPHGCPVARYYLNVFPASSAKSPGHARTGPRVTPPDACSGGALAAGLQPAVASSVLPGCADRVAPRSVVRGHARVRHGRLLLRGTARDRGCRARVARVTVTVGKRVARGHCRYLGANGRLGQRRRCLRGAPQLLARGRARWKLNVRARLPRGRYVLLVRAVDTAGNTERARRRGSNVARLHRRQP